jgi:hypothetical protein
MRRKVNQEISTGVLKQKVQLFLQAALFNWDQK